MANTSTSITTSSSKSREGSAKSTVADQMTQAIQSTSNLLHLMLQSSPSQAELTKLPRNFLAKSSTIRNTELTLEQMPRVISSLDAHIDNGVPHLRTAMLLLSNIESSQLKSLKAQLSPEAPEPVEKPAETGEGSSN